MLDRAAPATSGTGVDPKLARRVVLDELFDFSLYQSLRGIATGELRLVLERLIVAVRV